MPNRELNAKKKINSAGVYLALQCHVRSGFYASRSNYVLLNRLP